MEEPAGEAAGLGGLRALGPPALAEPLPRRYRPAAAHLPPRAREHSVWGAAPPPSSLPRRSVSRPDFAFPVPGNQPRCPILVGGQAVSPSADVRPQQCECRGEPWGCRGQGGVWGETRARRWVPEHSKGQSCRGHPPRLLVILQDAHVAYVEAAAQLRAQTYKLPSHSNRAATQDILRSMVLPPFVPQDGLRIPTAEGTEVVEEAGGKAAARLCPQEPRHDMGTRARNRRPAGAGSWLVTPCPQTLGSRWSSPRTSPRTWHGGGRS